MMHGGRKFTWIVCQLCSKRRKAYRKDTKYCGEVCRKRAERLKTPTLPGMESPSVETAARVTERPKRKVRKVLIE